MELFRNPIGPIISELWFEMYVYLINVEKIDFLIRKTDWLQSEIFLVYTSPRLIQN